MAGSPLTVIASTKYNPAANTAANPKAAAMGAAAFVGAVTCTRPSAFVSAGFEGPVHLQASHS